MKVSPTAAQVAMMGAHPRSVVDTAGPTGTGVVWTSDDSEHAGWKYVLLTNRGNADQPVGVDYEQIGLAPEAECDVTGLWDSKEMG